MLRVLVGTYAVVYLSIRIPYLLSFAHQRAQQFQAVGVLSWMDAPLHPLHYQTLVALALFGAVGFAVGYAYRVVAPTFAALLLVVLTYANSWGASSTPTTSGCFTSSH